MEPNAAEIFVFLIIIILDHTCEYIFRKHLENYVFQSCLLTAPVLLVVIVLTLSIGMIMISDFLSSSGTDKTIYIEIILHPCTF